MNKKFKDSLGEFLFDHNQNLTPLTTGSIVLDTRLGGMPTGIITEIFGHEGSGKSTFVLHMIKRAQIVAPDKYQFYIDSEGGLCNIEFLKSMGLNMEKLIIAKMSEGQKAFDFCCEAMQSGDINLIVIDSLAALMSQNELEDSGEMIGSFSRMVSKGLKKIISTLHRYPINFFVVNQVRSKIGIGDFWKGESNTTSTGGKSVKFYSGFRLEIQRQDFLKVSENVIGMQIKMKVVKSRISIPQVEYVFPVLFKNFGTLSQGFAIELDIVNAGIELGIIKQGSWLRVDGLESKSFRNIFHLAEHLKEDQKLATRIVTEFKQKYA